MSINRLQQPLAPT